MERPHEFLNRLVSIVPERDRPKLTAIAKTLESMGRPYVLPDPDLKCIKKPLEELGVYMSPGDKLCVIEPWDRPGAGEETRK